jgi:DNA-binding transcriptional regulator LsrR (DeoR family)
MREYLGAGGPAARRMAGTPARAFVLQQFIDSGGRDWPCSLGERNLAVPLAAIRRAAAAHPRRKVILAAAGAPKAAAVAAAIRGGLASVLVADAAIGEALLEEFPS